MSLATPDGARGSQTLCRVNDSVVRLAPFKANFNGAK
jgi:hypothetical protein